MASKVTKKDLEKKSLLQGRNLQGISADTTRILKKEVEDCEFELKQSLSDLDAEDIVAFANSDGGIILVGIENNTTNIVGCGDASSKNIDRVKRSILGKALNCRPPIPVVIDVENKKRNKPIFKVKIPAMGVLCCTSGGVYKQRRDGQNTLISPTEIVARVLEHEAKEFAARLEKAAGYLEAQIEGVQIELEDVQSTVDGLDSTVEDYERSLREIADEISTVSGNTEVLLDDAMGNIISSIKEHWEELSYDNSYLRRGMRNVEELLTSLLLVAKDKKGSSYEDVAEEAVYATIERHSLANPDGPGCGVRMVLEMNADQLNDTYWQPGSNIFVATGITGHFLLGKCPYCERRDILLIEKGPKTEIWIENANPLKLAVRCPECRAEIHSAEKLITHPNW